MKVTLFHLVLALPSIAFAQAIPKPLPVSERGPRVRVGSFCIDELYDRCEDGEVVLRKCEKLHGKLDDSISSLIINTAYGCYFYKHRGCLGAVFKSPDWGHMVSNVGPGFNDRASAVYCWEVEKK